MVFVTSDPHGHLDVLVETLQLAELLDEHQNWSGAEQSLWVLGDLMDRGPDGVGVVDLAMRLEEQAAAAGGHVGVLLGNHEVLAVGMYRYGREPSTDPRVQSLVLNWERNGGRVEDQERLTDRHVAWLAALPAMVDFDGHLLVHSDTAEYLEYGSDIDTINTAITDVLDSGDIDAWWVAVHRMTDRYAFAQAGGVEAAEQMMKTLGVRRIVHGHSIIADLRGIDPQETDAALLYARRQVLAIDGGIYAGGPCLVVNLDGWPD
jgi:hypothetical protein